MEHPDPLGPCVIRDGEPVDEAEDRGRESADDACRDVPERDVRERVIPGDEVDDVEDDGHRQQTERDHDEHRMDGMSQQLDPAFHHRRSVRIFDVPPPSLSTHDCCRRLCWTTSDV